MQHALLRRWLTFLVAFTLIFSIAAIAGKANAAPARPASDSITANAPAGATVVPGVGWIKGGHFVQTPTGVAIQPERLAAPAGANVVPNGCITSWQVFVKSYNPDGTVANATAVAWLGFFAWSTSGASWAITQSKIYPSGYNTGVWYVNDHFYQNGAGSRVDLPLGYVDPTDAINSVPNPKQWVVLTGSGNKIQFHFYKTTRPAEGGTPGILPCP